MLFWVFKSCSVAISDAPPNLNYPKLNRPFWVTESLYMSFQMAQCIHKKF